MTVLVIDVGGTKISSAIADRDKLTDVQTVPSSGDVLTTIEKIIQDRTTKKIRSISIGWAGWVTRDGVIAHSPHLPVEHFDLPDHLKKITKIPVCVDNDANLFALAEATRIDEHGTLLGIPLGTGIGAGVVQNGEVFRGAQNFSGEIGHQQIGALRAEQWFAGVSPDLDGHVDERIGMLAEWLANLALAFDPAVIALGGSVGINVWKPHLEKLQELIDHRFAEFPKSPKIICTDDRNAVLRGAALAAMK